MELDVESLRTFLAVLEHGSFTRAAESLHLGQSAVSWKMKRLETKVGRPLLERDGREIRPSRAGRAILDDARALVEAHDRAVQRLGSAELTGTVRIAANEAVGIGRLTSMLGSFRRVHPNVQVAFVIAPSEEIRRAIDRGDLDLALTEVVDDELHDDDVILWSQQLVWATARNAPHDLEPVPVVAYDEVCRYRAHGLRQLTDAGIDHDVLFTIPHGAGVRAAVEHGLGVAVLADHELGARLVPWPRAATLPALPVMHEVLRRSSDPSTPTIDALAGIIADEVAAPGPRALDAG